MVNLILNPQYVFLETCVGALTHIHTCVNTLQHSVPVKYDAIAAFTTSHTDALFNTLPLQVNTVFIG